MKLQDRIFNIQSESQFLDIALDIYKYQKENCSVYREYVQNLDWPEPKNLKNIPFIPISFFKTHKVVDSEAESATIFKSSGTGGERSHHYVTNIELYEKSFDTCYRDLIGKPEDQVILALLPNYIEQGESSLVYMVDNLISKSDKFSGFVLGNLKEIELRYNDATQRGKQVVIFGVSYALLDLCELKPNLEKAIIIETGGMKGRREELTKAELHAELKSHLQCANIYSEYGMTELLSQGYSKSDLTFETPAWMKILIRDTNDPFSYVDENKTGGINVIDLANIHSCSFIATQDLGKKTTDGFEIMGRFDQSDIRGCNLLVQ